MLNVGPPEGWRIVATGWRPRAPRPSTRPIVVVVLPSPSGVGVIAVCNIRIPGSKPEESFALRGGVVINPINWRTDASPALPKEHPGAVFHNRAEIHPDRQIIVRPRFCGAVVDTENALVNLTHLPPKINPPLGTRRFGTQVWGVFGMCFSRNANDRVRSYKFLHKGIKLPNGN